LAQLLNRCDASVQTLPGQHLQPDFGHVEPTAPFRGERMPSTAGWSARASTSQPGFWTSYPLDASAKLVACLGVTATPTRVRNTGVLTLTYDDGQDGGGCTLHLTYASARTGTLSYTCNSGVEGQGTWRISEIGTPLAPNVVPRRGTDTELEVRFTDSFERGETRAYDFQWRPKILQGAWKGACLTFTNRTGRAEYLTVSPPIISLEPGTVYEARYRYRNSSRCGEGTSMVTHRKKRPGRAASA
jgi:hypothetical protein